MTWADRFSWWLSEIPAPASSSINWSDYGLAGVVAAVLGGIILRLFFQMRGDLLDRVQAAEKSCSDGIAAVEKQRIDALAAGDRQHSEALGREREALTHERERADRLEAALARLNAEVGPRQAAAMDNAMKAVTDAIRELKK